MMRLGKVSKAGIFCLLFLGAVLSASAQDTLKYKASILKIDSTGFYKIELSPFFIAKSNANLSDVRVAGPDGKFIPYIKAGNLPKGAPEKFIDFREVAIKSKTDTGTTFIIESKEKAPVNRLWIKLKNTDVKRSVNLSGSDDLERWFAIKEDIPLQEAEMNSDGTYLQSMSFPASNYRYLKLLVNDKNKAPVKFVGAGIYSEQSLVDLYLPIPSAKIIKKEKNKVNFISIELNDNFLVNKIQLIVSSPKYYKRDVSVYSVDNQERRFITSTELNSGKPADIFLSAKTKRLELQIADGDNLPLNIDKIEVLQADHHVVSYLEAGKSYQLLTGNANALEPDYDLKFFTDSIQNHLRLVGHGAVTRNNALNPQPATVKRDYAVIMWVSIIATLMLLSYLTWKMMKEVNGKKG